MCIKCFVFVCVCCCAAAGIAGGPSAHLIVLVNGIDFTDGGNKSIDTVDYALNDHLSFSCDCQNVKQEDGYGELVVHQWNNLLVYYPDGLQNSEGEHSLNSAVNNILGTSSVSVNQFVHNVTYNIYGDDVDHKSEVYCIEKIWDKTINNYTFIQSDPVKLISCSGQSISNSIHTIYYNESNPATHNCHKSGVDQSNILTRKIVDGRVYNVSEVKDVPLTPADSGLILFCETMHSEYIAGPSNKVNYTREIVGTTKYQYYSTNAMSLYIQIGIGVAVFAVVFIVLVAGIYKYRNKLKPPDPYATQHVYAELVLPESQAPRNLSRNREEPPYVHIIGFLRSQTNNTTASVA